MAEDPTAFDYDGVYDSMKKAGVKEAYELKVTKEGIERKPRYVQSIMDRAKEHKREQDIIYTRKLIKESEKEGQVYGETEKFMTSAYKKKLEEDQIWLKQKKQEQEEEERKDVTKQNNFRLGFYSNFLNEVSKDKEVQISAAYKPPSQQKTNNNNENNDDNLISESDDNKSVSDKNRTNKTEERENEETQYRERRRVHNKNYDNDENVITIEEIQKKRKEAEEQKKKQEEEEEIKKLVRRNDDGAVNDAKQRYLQRKQLLKQTELHQLQQNT